MKNIALTIAAVATLGLAACNNTDDAAVNETNAAATDLEATTDEAVNDVSAAGADAVNATDAALDSAGNSIENGAEAVENAVDGDTEVNGM